LNPCTTRWWPIIRKNKYTLHPAKIDKVMKISFSRKPKSDDKTD
jgi:hypothetical protein